MRIHHVNLQAAVGGGEVYTRWLTRALADAGAEVTLYVELANRFWDGLAGERVALAPVSQAAEIWSRLPERGALILTQSPLPAAFLERAARAHHLAGFAHMPVHGRSAEGFRRFALVLTVSHYCLGLLRAAGLNNVYDEPLYGTCALERPGDGPIVARSPYHWDRRKFRDRVLARLEPLAEPFRTRPVFVKGPGLTLGIVSLLSPIKQFPLLFATLAPILAARPAVRLEVFGDGGYAQVRDLRRALAPLGERVRFWGYQRTVQDIYPQLDYLMTGLPEKEALGLNALEAQACGTPVLAPDAPPFTETVLEGASGYRYRDPRDDGGAGFARLLDALLTGERPRPDPRIAAREHLAQFGYEALVGRARRLLAELARRFPDAA